jgi:acyl homoserine lactone synthase
MLRYIYGDTLDDYPDLKRQMFRHRAYQFKERLGWDVDVDANGFERDAYDDLNPLYVIWDDPAGQHGGSMRFLPTVGRTMVAEHFSHLTDTQIASPFIWECTRFCLAPQASARVAGALMLAGGELMKGFYLTHLLGVFDARMVRIYNMIGAVPAILGSDGSGKDKISVGLWPYREIDRLRVQRRAGISAEVSTAWFNRSFGFINSEQKVS